MNNTEKNKILTNIDESIDIDPLSISSIYLEMIFNNGIEDKVILTGTAFLMVSPNNKHIIFTNRHNVTAIHQQTGMCLDKMGRRPNRIKIYLVTASFKRYWHPFTIDLYKDMNLFLEPIWIEHPILKSSADFVGLRLPKNFQSTYGHYTSLNLSSLKSNGRFSFSPSQAITIIGFPFGKTVTENEQKEYFPIWVTGHIASEPQVNYNGLPIFLVDCRSRSGQSGSPVFFHRNNFLENKDNEMEFLGIYSGRIHPDSDIGMVWRRIALEELLKEADLNEHLYFESKVTVENYPPKIPLGAYPPRKSQN